MLVSPTRCRPAFVAGSAGCPSLAGGYPVVGAQAIAPGLAAVRGLPSLGWCPDRPIVPALGMHSGGVGLRWYRRHLGTGMGEGHVKAHKLTPAHSQRGSRNGHNGPATLCANVKERPMTHKVGHGCRQRAARYQPCRQGCVTYRSAKGRRPLCVTVVKVGPLALAPVTL